MKVKQKILIVVIGYIIAVFLLILGTKLYIKNKTEKLKSQAYERFDNFFKNQKGFVDTEYAYGKVKYSQTSNPEKEPEKGFDFYGYHDAWEERHSDIYRYYKIDDIYNGWRLSWAGNIRYGTMLLYSIYPSYVCYKKQEYEYMYNFIPSVENCVNKAYDFWVSNPKSNYFDLYQKGCMSRISDLINDIPNEYYDWRHITHYKDSLCNVELLDYMYDNYYKVFNGRTNYQTYEIQERDGVINNERKSKVIAGGIVLTIFLLFFVIFLIIQNNRNEREIREHEEEFRKKRNEPIYDRLKDLCNPAKFLNPYDKEKVEKANSIYEQLMNTSCSDIETLKILRQQAINELNLNFVAVEYLQDLKSQCNPERFLRPYNAEKVRIANELYNKLIDNEKNIEILERIEMEMKEKLL